MNLLGAKLYDPSTAATASTSANLALTALDTTNLRLTVTVPAHGFLFIRMRCNVVTASVSVVPGIILGTLNGSTVTGRIYPQMGSPTAVSGAGTVFNGAVAEFTVTGQTPGSITLDAAYGVELLAAAGSAIKWGGPNNTTTADNFGAFLFEIWDPQPIPTAAPGAAGGLPILGANTGDFQITASSANTPAVKFLGLGTQAGLHLVGGATGNAFTLVGGATSGDGVNITTTSGHGINAVATGTAKDALHLTGAAASGANAAGHALNLTGGASSTTGGGTAGVGLKATGGAGSATTNGAGEAVTVAAGGTTTVAGASAVSFTGTGAFHGLISTSGGGATGDGIKAVSAATNGNGLNLVGLGTGQGLLSTAGLTGNGMKLVGGGTSGHGLAVTTTSGDGFNLAPTAGHGITAAGNGTTKHGINATGGATTSAGISATGGATSGDGIIAAATTSGHGLVTTGVGTTKHGISATGGATTSHGISAVGGATSGDGINAVATTSGHGLTVTGVGTTKHGINASGGSTTSHGISATGGGVGHGILATSGSGATGDGIKAVAASTDGNGMELVGHGVGAGQYVTAGATGPGVSFNGGATSGNALDLIATTSGSGLNIQGFGSGNPAVAIVAGGANAAGISAQGNGTAAGIISTGGNTGPGVKLVGGSSSGHGLLVNTTSGDAFNLSPTAGHGINIAANGTTKHGINSVGGATTSHGICAVGGATSGDGINASAATSGVGLNVAGAGTTKPGILATGGTTTSAGLSLVGGGTSGDGLLIATTSGHGMNITATGTAKDALHLVGAAAATTNAGGHGINAIGGASTTSAGGTAGVGFNLLGGAGSASTNGAGDGFVSTGGGTTTVSGGAGVTFTHTGSKFDLNATTTPLTLAKTTNITGFNDITAAAAATAVWQDLTASSDFTTNNSIGKLLVTDIDATISSRGTGTGTALSAAQVATAVWTDTTAGDFTTALSIGKSVMNGVTLGTGLTINAYTGDTPQTGDGYAIVNSATFGNAKLVRATTPANTLDVSATGEAGLDWANIGSPTTTQNLSGTTVKTATDIATQIAALNNLSQTQVTGGAYALNNASFAFNSGLDFTTTQKTSLGTAVGTAQTGDNFAIVNSATFGNAKLVRSTTPANTLDVSATGEAGIDWANVGSPTTSLALTNTTIAIADATSDAVIADAVWNALTASYGTAGTYGLLIETDLDATISSRAPSATALSTATWTGARAVYLDNLNVGGPVASHADILALNQSASKHVLIQTVGQYERPESGTTTYTVEARTFDASTGTAVDADVTPTISPVGSVSGDLSANLGAVGTTETGVYRATYTVLAAATAEQIRFDLSATIAATTFTLSCYTQVVDDVSTTWTSTDAGHLTSIFNKLPSRPYLTGSEDSAGLVDVATVDGNALVQTAGKLWVLDGSGNAVASHTDITSLNNLSSANVSAAVWNAATASYGTAGSYGLLVETNLDVTVGSRLASADYVVPPTVGAIADAVWDETIAGHLTAGSTGATLSAASTAADPWLTSLPAAYAAGSAGYIVGTNLDAKVTAAKLAADGLDAISVADPGSPANQTTFPKRMIALWRRFFKKVIKDNSGSTITQYADDGTTVNSTQAFVVTPTSEEVDAAT